MCLYLIYKQTSKETYVILSEELSLMSARCPKLRAGALLDTQLP
jgi:hypothetical protein